MKKYGFITTTLQQLFLIGSSKDVANRRIPKKSPADIDPKEAGVLKDQLTQIGLMDRQLITGEFKNLFI